MQQNPTNLSYGQPSNVPATPRKRLVAAISQMKGGDTNY